MNPLLRPALLLLPPLLCGCNPAPAAGPERPAPDPAPIRLAPVAERAGIRFRLGHGGRSPLTILETAGGGAAFLDYDQDEWPDILLVGPHRLALYHNERDGTFRDVTAGSGLDPNRYWMGCATGDYDGDGLPDVFLSGYRCHALYRNTGEGRFVDTARGSGISGLDWSLGAAFADVNLDGSLDLFVSQYLRFGSGTAQVCALGAIRSACGPEAYEPLSGRLFLNQSGRRFLRSPRWKDTGKTWGVLASDLFGTGRPALYLANDMMPGDLWAFGPDGHENVGPASGTAFDAQGHLQGGMGVDSGDYDNDGKLDLLVTTFFAQPDSLYHNDGDGFFSATSGPAGLGGVTMPYVGFGTAFADLDNDGWLDVVIANGHVRDNIAQFDASQSYAQPMQVFRNHNGQFVDCSSRALEGVAAIVGRGLAAADYNRDGRLDLLVCDLEGQAVLLENRSPEQHWLGVRLTSGGLNRFGIGAMVALTAGGRKQLREIKTSGSVLSAHDPAAHFGLGNHAGPVRVAVRWPDGARQDVAVPQPDRWITIRRPAGLVR
jgi:hypothetical protein